MSKRVWPQPGDLGFATKAGYGVDYTFCVARRDSKGIPLHPTQLVGITVGTPVIYVGENGRDIWFTPQGLYVQLIPTAQVSKD